MKDLSQYPVTFGYGATDGVFYYPPTPSHPKTANWVGNYHRGDDRACPVGTPVIVNGTQIGLSGNSGASSGPHCHIARFVTGQDTNPQGQGFNLKAPVSVTTVGHDDINGNYIRLTDAAGVVWVYLHLSQQNVKQGQTLSSNNSSNKEIKVTQEQLDQIITTIGTGVKQIADILGVQSQQIAQLHEQQTAQISEATRQLAVFIGDARKEIQAIKEK